MFICSIVFLVARIQSSTAALGFTRFPARSRVQMLHEFQTLRTQYGQQRSKESRKVDTKGTWWTITCTRKIQHSGWFIPVGFVLRYPRLESKLHIVILFIFGRYILSKTKNNVKKYLCFYLLLVKNIFTGILICPNSCLFGASRLNRNSRKDGIKRRSKPSRAKSFTTRPSCRRNRKSH